MKTCSQELLWGLCLNGMCLGFMSESHFLHGKMNLWLRDGLSVVLPLSFLKSAFGGSCVGASWRNFWCLKPLCLKIILNFTCAVLGSQLCGSAGCSGGLFKELFFSYHFVLQRFNYLGWGWQPGLKYVCFPGEASHLEILHVCSGWEMKSWIFKQSTANDFM